MPRRRKSRLSAYPWLKKKLLRRLETPEQRAIRLEKNRKRIANRRVNETEEEREERRLRNREAARSRRANAKYLKRLAQRKISPLEENCHRRKSKEKAAKQTRAMIQEMNSDNHKPLWNRGERRQNPSDEDNEYRRYNKTNSVYSAGSCVPLSHPFQMRYDQQMFMSMCPKTPEQILQLGLVACPGDILCRSPAERILAYSDDNENDWCMGMECEVKIEEGEELEEKKLFDEEKPVNEVEIQELPKCGPSLVECKPSIVQARSAYDKESLANVKTPKEEIPQPSNSQQSTESFSDENTPEEIPQPSNSQQSTESFSDENTPEEIPQPSNSQQSTKSFSDENTPEEIPQPSNSQQSTESFSDENTPEEIPQPSNSQQSTESFSDENTPEEIPKFSNSQQISECLTDVNVP